MQIEAGMKELRAQLSTYLRRVKRGETIIITERGKPVGQIVPIPDSLEGRLEVLRQSGLIAWNGRKLSSTLPEVTTGSNQSIADILLNDRE